MAIELRASANVSVTASADWTSRPTHATVWIGTNRLDAATISPALTEDVENGDTVRILDEGAATTLTITGVGEAALNAILAAGTDEVTATVRLHSASPGTGGDNELDSTDEPGYARLTISLESVVV